MIMTNIFFDCLNVIVFVINDLFFSKQKVLHKRKTKKIHQIQRRHYFRMIVISNFREIKFKKLIKNVTRKKIFHQIEKKNLIRHNFENFIIR